MNKALSLLIAVLISTLPLFGQIMPQEFNPKTGTIQFLQRGLPQPFSLNHTEVRDASLDTITSNLQSCDDVFYTWKFGPGSGEQGYLSGHNTNLDSAKAEYYEDLPGDSIKGVWMLFGKATFTNNTQKIHVKVWDATGPNGSPGNELANKEVTHQVINNNVNGGNLTTVYFDSPVPNPGDVYIGFKLIYKKVSGQAVYDSTRLVVLANPDIFDGCSDDSSENFAWELNTAHTTVQGDGMWHSYWDSYNIATRNPIFPIVTIDDACAIAVNPSSPSICKSKSVTLNATGATSYSWAPSEGLNVTTGPTVSASPKNTTTYTVTGNGGACSSTVKVTVNPKPDASISAAPCSGGSVLITCVASPSTGVKFKWFKNGVKISGATNSTYSATTSGEYKCKVTITATGCSKTSNKLNINVNCKEGILDPSWDVFTYPNPFGSTLSLAINTSSPEPVDIQLLDLTGKQVKAWKMNETGQSLQIDGPLPPGVYFIKVKQADREKMIRVVKGE